MRVHEGEPKEKTTDRKKMKRWRERVRRAVDKLASTQVLHRDRLGAGPGSRRGPTHGTAHYSLAYELKPDPSFQSWTYGPSEFGLIIRRVGKNQWTVKTAPAIARVE